MARVDREANEGKKQVDRLAAKLLEIDSEAMVSAAGDVAFRLLGPSPVRLFVTGGAGAGKSTMSSTIAERLNIPCFDFDEYVPGGYTPNAKEYRSRLVKGMSNLWDDLPQRGWVVEHVEACSEDMVKAFKPTHCLLISTPASQLLTVARARAASSSSPRESYEMEQRALESSEYARAQFEKTPGKIIARGKGWLLKETS